MSRACTVTGCEFGLSTVEGMRSSKWCYWHRLMRMTPDAQERAGADRFAEAQPPDLVPRGRGAESARVCLVCGWVIPSFYLDGPRCRACARVKRRESRDSRTYTFPPGYDRARLEKLQARRCAGCGSKQQSQALSLDHDHGSGLVRGLLCDRCNHDLLGAGFDSVRILANLLFYFQHPPTSGRWIAEEEREALGWRLKWVRDPS